MTVKELAYYLWNYFRTHDGEQSAEENWLFAEWILEGNRPVWLFSRDDFKPFTTPHQCGKESLSGD